VAWCQAGLGAELRATISPSAAATTAGDNRKKRCSIWSDTLRGSAPSDKPVRVWLSEGGRCRDTVIDAAVVTQFHDAGATILS
jgi:hypothetical protein